MKRGIKRHTGFAMVTAIMLLSLCAITITLLGEAVFNQGRRTRAAGEEAQLRQLLIAGEAFVQSQADSSGRWMIAVPDDLKQEGAGLTVALTGDSSDRKIAEIDASLSNHHRSQRVTLVKESGGWQVTDVKLGE